MTADAPGEASDRRVAIVGLGYVGLPLALAFHEAGLDVVGLDSSAARIAELRSGRSPIDDIDDERLGRGLASGLRISTTDDADPSAVDAVVVCVPTPITSTKDPDLRPVLAAADYLCGRLRRGPAHHPAVDDVPRHDERPVPRGTRTERSARRDRLRPRVRAGARQPG